MHDSWHQLRKVSQLSFTMASIFKSAGLIQNCGWFCLESLRNDSWLLSDVGWCIVLILCGFECQCQSKPTMPVLTPPSGVLAASRTSRV
eukprot:2210314-Amphidinium_carterae.1